jgi:hypothetical protein
MQLVLQVNEAVVTGCVKGASSQDGTDYKRPHQCGLWLDNHPLKGLACSQLKLGERLAAAAPNTSFARQILNRTYLPCLQA